MLTSAPHNRLLEFSFFFSSDTYILSTYIAINKNIHQLFQVVAGIHANIQDKAQFPFFFSPTDKAIIKHKHSFHVSVCRFIWKYVKFEHSIPLSGMNGTYREKIHNFIDKCLHNLKQTWRKPNYIEKKMRVFTREFAPKFDLQNLSFERKLKVDIRAHINYYYYHRFRYIDVHSHLILLFFWTLIM